LADPLVAAPEVICFNEIKAIKICWAADNCADEYLLYRKADAASQSEVLLYRGTLLEYTDTNGINEERYLYSLSKIRGLREFGPSAGVLGVFSDTIQDAVEPNNIQVDASWLEADIKANLYYYKDRNGNVVQDEDWYYVEIPPRRAAYITIIQDGLDAADTFLNLSQQGEVPFRVQNNTLFPIENYANSTQRIHFRLYPSADKFLLDASQAGGTLVGYLLTLKSIADLP